MPNVRVADNTARTAGGHLNCASPHPPLDGWHHANRLARVGGIAGTFDVDSPPLGLTSESSGIAGGPRVADEQRAVILPREVNQSRIVSNRKHGGCVPLFAEYPRRKALPILPELHRTMERVQGSAVFFAHLGNIFSVFRYL